MGKSFSVENGMFMMFKSTSDTSLKIHTDVLAQSPGLDFWVKNLMKTCHYLMFFSCFNSPALVICEEGTEIFRNSLSLPFSV